LVLVSAFVIGYIRNSVSLTVAIILSLLAAATTISDASEKRREITSKVSVETMVIEIVLTLSTAVVPTVLWWLISPSSTWFASLLVFLVFSSYGAVMELVEELMKENPGRSIIP
jgi:hypothetical protein